MRTEGRTKEIVAFRYFANAPKMGDNARKGVKRLITLSQKNATIFLCISKLSVRHVACDNKASFTFIFKLLYISPG
jgi:hypothetical protein